MTRLLVFILCFASFTLSAQNKGKADSLQSVRSDSLIVESRDTVLLTSYATRYDPRKALLYAAVIPGLGQVYNKKYWKIPLVYGGMGWVGYYINAYQKGYTKYKLELYDVLNGGVAPSGLAEAPLRSLIDRYRRERDFMIIIMGGIYLLQIIDAHVDAHLKEFDLNPNLQVRMEPMYEINPMLGRQGGFSIYIKF